MAGRRDGPERMVFATLAEDRFFHLPAEHGLPEGALVLRSLTGQRLEVDPEAAAAFEVSEAEAQALVQTQMRGFLDRARQGLGTLNTMADQLVQAAKDAPTEGHEERMRAREERLSGALGIGVEQVRDPQQLMDGFTGLLDRIQHALNRPAGQPGDAVSEAMAPLAGLEEEASADATLGALEEGLAEVFGPNSTARDALDAAMSRLRKAGAELDALDLDAVPPAADGEEPDGS